MMEKPIVVRTNNSEKIIKGTGHYASRGPRNFREMIEKTVSLHSDLIAFHVKDKKTKEITDITYREFKNHIDCLGAALYSKLNIADRNEKLHFAIICENRYEWGISYMATVTGLGVAVPLDKNLTEIEIENLIVRGKTKVVFYSNKYQSSMEKFAEKYPDIELFVCMDKLDNADVLGEKFVYIYDLVKAGTAGAEEFTKLPQDTECMSVLLFTSGTTALSKGVMLSAKNLCFNIDSGLRHVNIHPGDVHLSLLPLHHTFESTIGFLIMLTAGVTIAYCDGVKYVQKNLQEYNVSILVGVPAILETIYKRVQDGIKKSGKEALVKMLLKVSNSLRKIGIDLRRVLFKSIINQLSPALRLAVVGAAPIDPEVVKNFEDMGITLLQGYGLTETAPLVAANTEKFNICGTTGFPLYNVEIKIDNPDESGQGEIMVRGDNVMLGYYENPEETENVITPDGWFRTGDLGRFNEDNTLTITGRCKSMIVFDNGKKAFPEEYEVLMTSNPKISEAFAWGHVKQDGAVQISVKIVPNLAEFKDCNQETIIGEIEEIVKEINENLPNYKAIRWFFLSDIPTIKTTTLKIKRTPELESVNEQLEANGLVIMKANKKYLQ